MTNPTAAMIVIGDEILSGRTQDANMHHLAQELATVGIDFKQARVVKDDVAEIIEAVNALRPNYTHVFTSGGIGPTHDDITATSIAEAFGVAIDVRADALAVLATAYPNGEADLNASRLQMARIPDGAQLIDNPVSKAPGFSLENVHVMAGVPAIFAAMLAGLLPRLGAGEPMSSETVCVELPEGEIAGPLGKLAQEYPNLSIGSYPFYLYGKFGSNIVVRGQNSGMVAQAVAELSDLFGENIT